MTLANPSSSWQKLQDVYYHIRPCYETLEWDLADVYSNFRVRTSANVSLLALASRFVPHPNVITIYSLSGKKLWTLVYNSGGTNDHIVDFAFAGERLCVVLANSKVRVYTDFWGTFDEYSCLDNVQFMTSGTTASDTPRNDNFKYVITNLEDESTERPLHVVATHVWGEYLVVQYSDHMKFMHTADFDVYEVPFPGLHPQQVHCLCPVSDSPSSLSFIMAYENTVYTIHCDFAKQTYEFVDERLTDGPFTMMSASVSGKLVALFNADSQRVFVTTRNFDNMLLEYDTSNESSVPYMVKWAGNDAIVLSLRDEIKLIGPGQKSLSFFYDVADQGDFEAGQFNFGQSGFGQSGFGQSSLGQSGITSVIPIIRTQIDGLTIITGTKVEFLSRVAQASINVFMVGSTDPSYVLLDCVDKLASQASRADSNISLLKSEGTLVDAIDACLEAALEEFVPHVQKLIMKAASFGKIYVDSGYNADKYLRVLNTLKALNQLRSADVGVFLTHSQLSAVGWPAVIERLLARSLHYLALQMAELLDLQDCKPAIYIHWCCCKIRSERNMSDVDLFRVISKKLLSYSNDYALKGPAQNFISTAEIFKVSLQEGRTDLCKLLVNLEPSPLRRVTSLLEMDEIDLALIKCFQTCDYNLCVLILRHLHNKLSPAEFQRVLNQNELVEVIKGSSYEELLKDDQIKHLFKEKLFVSGNLIGNLWKESTAKHDPVLLKQYLKNTHNTTELNFLRLKTYSEQELGDENLTEFTEIYNDQKSQLTRLMSDKKLKSMVQVELATLDLRYKLSNTYQQSFFGEKSVVDIIVRLIKMYQLKPAAKVIKDFKLPQAKLWNLVVNLYCESGDFDRLNKFIVDANPNATVFKAPIKFETIVETCLVFECPKQYVSTYISHCSDSSYSEKVKLYMRNDDMISAAEEAFNNKDAELLRVVLDAVPPDAEELGAIKSFINRLG